MLFMIVAFVHVVACILLIVAVLLQSGKDAGLSGAFGMGGGGQTIFGARAGDVLTRATTVLAVTFVITCLVFTRIRPIGAGSVASRSVVTKVPEQPAAPKGAAPIPVPAAPGAGAAKQGAK
jgi:preprotein translocase subunit SecG